MRVRAARGVAGAVVLLLTMSACADFSLRDWWRERWETGTGTWEHPTLPWEQWDVDRAECRMLAREEAERDFAVAEEGRAPETYSRAAPITRPVDRFEAERRLERLFERCMQSRGYVRVQRADQHSHRPPQ